jgi:hypothetical protein
LQQFDGVILDCIVSIRLQNLGLPEIALAAICRVNCGNLSLTIVFGITSDIMSTLSNDDERVTLERELQLLNQEHRDLDAETLILDGLDSKDQLQIQRLKKRKLALKDRIVLISGKLRPDIIA